MTEHDNVRVAREAFDAWNAHDAGRYVRLLDSDFVAESDALPEPVRGSDAQREVVEMFLRAFPDLTFTIQELLPVGDRVVARWEAAGTHRGELMGLPPTNRRTAGINGCTVMQVRNGRLLREWVYWDTARMLRQLGAIPPLAPPAVL